MSVNLQKGQKIDLTKGNEGLKQIMVGLGWDAAQSTKKGLFGLFAAQPPAIDCDASVLLCGEDGKVRDKTDIVYFGNLRHKSGAVTHQGDNLTGDGDGDDEQIMINLAPMPKNYDKLVFVVNIYKAHERGQHFGMIANAFIRLVDTNGNKEICRYNLSEHYDGMTAMIMGEVYRHENEWKFNAIGQATNDRGLQQLAARYS